MKTIITLPFPVSVNAMYANRKNGGRQKSKRYLTWANAAGWELKSQSPISIKGRVNLDVVFQRKDRRRRDISNLIKSVEDLLVDHGIIEDDSLVDELRLSWGGHNSPGALVQIESVT